MVVQLIICLKMMNMKVEFKLTLPDGHVITMTKEINKLRDYRGFRKELRSTIKSLNLYIKRNLTSTNDQAS
jgi:hypothetical protein